jgi:hypothetical protein
VHQVTTVVMVVIPFNWGNVTMFVYSTHQTTVKRTDSKNNGGGDNKGSHKGFKYNRLSHDLSSIGIKATTDQIDRWREVDRA